MLIGEGVRIASLVDHGGLEVRIGEHALFLTIACVAIHLVDPLFNRLVSNASRARRPKIGASSLILDDL